MTPAVKNIVVPIGGTFSWRSLIQNAENGFSFDLTGYTITGQIRETPASRKKVCDMTGVINDAATGDFSLIIAAATTVNLKPGVYYWDFSIAGSGLVLFPAAGRATVIQTGTR